MSGGNVVDSAFGAQENFSGTVIKFNIGILVATFRERIEGKPVLELVERANEDADRFTELRVMLTAF